MRQNLLRALAVLAMALLFIGAIIAVPWPRGTGAVDHSTNEELGSTLFGDTVNPGYGLILVLIGLLLLVALLGGVFLAKEEGE